MGNIIDANSFFSKRTNSKDLENIIEYYKEYLSVNQGIVGFDEYYMIEHIPIGDECNFINIVCPHCGSPLNEETLDGEKVLAHGKIGEDEDLDNRSAWALIELVCPYCKSKSVVVME